MILCCGEALIDMVPISGIAGESGFAPLPGGAIFNTAISLGRLGQKVGFFSGLSTDLFGETLRDTLAESHVDCDLAHFSPRPTTLAFVRLEGGHASYTFYDENTAGRMLSRVNLPKVPGWIRACYFGGISLCAEPAAEAYATLAERVASDAVVMLDPNIRTGFIADELGYRARLERMIGVSDIVKVSDDDLNWIMPGADDLEAKAAALQAKGPALVIVTLGSDGAMAMTQAGVKVKAAAEVAQVVDTVGAGDTFNAGVLASLSDQGKLSKAELGEIDEAALGAALSRGAAVAAVTVSRAGANPPWAHELDD